MSDNRNIEFDKAVRSMLENATEEVPEHIWGSVCDRLDAVESGAEKADNPKRKYILPLWARISAGTAAAAVLAIVLTLSIQRIDSIHRGTNILSDNIIIPPATEQEISSEQKINPEPKVCQTTIHSILTKDDIIAGESLNESPEAFHAAQKQEIVSTETREEEEQEISTKNTSGDTLTGTSSPKDDLNDDFPDFDEEKPKRKVRTSFVISGNAISNTNSATGNNRSNIKPSYRPGINDLKHDKVTESSVSSYGIPFSFGIGAKIEFAKRWSVSAGVNYTLLSRTFAGTYYRIDENGQYSDTSFPSIRNRQDYIGIPVNFYFSIVRSKIIDFYAYAGGTAEKCVSNRFMMSSGNENFTHSEKVKGMQFSVNAGIGMEFVIANQFGIYLDPSIRYYFKNSRQPNSIRTVQPLMFGVELGFRIRL